jgi:hypothetical protein
MSRRTRHTIIYSLLSIVLTLLLIEAGLRLFDPWGVNRYYADQMALPSVERPGTDYTLRAGTYHLSTWTATELADHTRRLPDARHGSCRVAIIGDSVTWGYGVSDSLTFVNRLASQFPTVEIINPSYSGYNSEQVRTLVNLYPADAYVYLVISNDPDASYQPGSDESAYTASAIKRYVLFITGALSRPNRSDWPRFWRDMAAMQADGRITFVAFDAPFGRLIAQRYPVHLIPMYHTSNSRMDGHPDAAGHAEIAATMLPIVRSAVERACTTVI